MISTSLKAYFVTLEILFGFNFRFVPCLNKKPGALAKYSYVSAVILFLLSILAVTYGPFTAYIYLSEYVLTFVLLKRSKRTVYDFFKDLQAIEYKWKMMVPNYSTLAVWLYTFFVFCLKWIIVIGYCVIFELYDLKNMARMLLPKLPLTVVDVLPIVNIVIFHNVYIRLNVLRTGLDESKYNIKEAQAIFNDIEDCFNEFRSHYDAVIFATLLYEPMKLMSSVYSHLYFSEKKPDWVIWLIGLIYPLHNTAQIILPAAYAEMIGAQIDAMKMVLHERLLIEQDEKEEQETVRFIEHLEFSGLLRKAWRLAPVDLRHPVAALHITASYTIVIIQFSQLLQH